MDEYAFLDEDGSASSGAQTPVEEQDDGDDFMPDAEPPEEEFDEELVEEEDEVGQENEEEESDEEDHGPTRPSVRDISAIESNEGSVPLTPINKFKKKVLHHTKSLIPSPKRMKTRPVENGDKLRTRGVADFSKIGGQEVRLKDLFGPEDAALKPILATRDYWYAQETLPLLQPGGLRRSFFENEGSREKEGDIFRSWYDDAGKDAFAVAQKSKELTTEEGAPYMSNSGPDALNVLWGAAKSLHVRALDKGSCVKVAEAFNEDQCRRGWLLNLGTRVQEAQWAPNEEGNTQYLAVAVEQKPMSGIQPKPMENLKAPAFSATVQFPASIQIWAFDATSGGKVETLGEPRLDLVICTDWGAPKQFRWSPLKATGGSEDVGNDSTEHIGLLAGIWSDGRVRILNIARPRLDVASTEPVYIHYTRAAFEISLPNTVPSCLHWLSAASLAVATAAGTVGIWTVTRPDTFASPGAHDYNPRPWFYQQLADTYILTISSGWPSQPQFLSISIADGFARLFDLRSPNADTTASIRGRTLCISQSWHEHTQTFVMPDEHYILKHTPIRRYYHNLYSMRLESSITRVATSPVHPALLVGAAEGNVEASNPIGRICNYKVIPWQQKWFTHEWRGPVEELIFKPPEVAEDVDMLESEPVEATSPSSMAGETTRVTQDILSQPLARIVEGHKAIQPGIQHSVTSKKPNNPETNKGVTIYEEQSAITALAWNPNLKYGTWAVAGMGDGLLRVEDIGV